MEEPPGEVRVGSWQTLASASKARANDCGRAKYRFWLGGKQEGERA